MGPRLDLEEIYDIQSEPNGTQTAKSFEPELLKDGHYFSKNPDRRPSTGRVKIEEYLSCGSISTVHEYGYLTGDITRNTPSTGRATHFHLGRGIDNHTRGVAFFRCTPIKEQDTKTQR
mgnify:CR=1 FL=1